MERKAASNEIDLLELLVQFFAALKRNIILTIALPLAGAAVALAVSYNSRDLFESDLLIETSLLSESECKLLFSQVDKAGKIPGLEPEFAKQLAGLKYEITRNEETKTVDKSIYVHKSVYIKVTARVYDEQAFLSVQNAIVKFLNESAPVIRHRNEQEKFYTEVISKINSEIQAMDEIKKQVSSKVQATYLNPADLFAKSVDLYKEKTEYEIKLQEIKSVHLIKGFESMTINAKMNKLFVALIGLVAGSLILLAVLFLKFFINYYKLYERSH